jgi:hypothetical protein
VQQFHVGLLHFFYMVQIDDKIISLYVFEKHFICDLPKCKGGCCVEGESGAPLQDNETGILDDIFPVIKSMLSKEALEIINKTGTWEIDSDGDKVTPIINGNECVYTYFDENGICKCTIEKAFNEGLIDFKKPISCHLYPIRITKYAKFEALNYHNWHVCEPARLLGAKVGVPIFRFLKDPIIRKFGEPFFKEMEEAEKLLLEQGTI